MDIVIKQISPIKVVSIEGSGKIPDFNRDVDKLYEYLYKNNLQDDINGSLIGLFYTEFGGGYIAAVPIKKEIPTREGFEIETLPFIKCLSAVHKGSHKTIEDSFTLLKQYEKDNGILWQFPVREIYLRSDGNESEFITEIQVPIT